MITKRKYDNIMSLEKNNVLRGVFKVWGELLISKISYY